MSGGGASLPANPTPAYTPANQPAADSGAFSGIGSLNTNPSSSYASGAASTGGANLTQGGQGNLPYAAQTLQTGFDPQQQLFNQQFQLQHDQSNVNNAQNGVSGTPYGAGLATQGDQNFDINWQNQQLARQQTAAGTASTLQGAAGSALQTGTQVQQSIPAFSNQQLQSAIADYMAYLGQGTSSSNAATGQYSAEANAATTNQAMENQSSAGLGSLFGNIAGIGASFL